MNVQTPDAAWRRALAENHRLRARKQREEAARIARLLVLAHMKQSRKDER